MYRFPDCEPIHLIVQKVQRLLHLRRLELGHRLESILSCRSIVRREVDTRRYGQCQQRTKGNTNHQCQQLQSYTDFEYPVFTIVLPRLRKVWFREPLR